MAVNWPLFKTEKQVVERTGLSLIDLRKATTFDPTSVVTSMAFRAKISAKIATTRGKLQLFSPKTKGWLLQKTD